MLLRALYNFVTVGIYSILNSNASILSKRDKARVFGKKTATWKSCNFGSDAFGIY